MVWLLLKNVVALVLWLREECAMALSRFVPPM